SPPADEEVPRHPLPSQPEPATESPPLPPLPPLEDSDDLVVETLIELFGFGMEELLVDASLIEKFVTTIDNLPRSHVAEKVRPLRRVAAMFSVEAREDGETYSISPSNYERYDLLVNLLTSVRTDNIVSTYRRFYPLLQQAYVNLGYPDGYFNDRVVEVIDHLLETPQTDDEILLVRPHVLYEYADPELETLSSGQKLLLRMGSKNAARVRQQLRELRVQLADNA
ncbi:MAG: DUF3014 domain-containing protein, partial [Gammaproteobacteria bacterium]|nr:DUF3014 domain-containing protein [Gammaproteobacteria bacterium]